MSTANGWGSSGWGSSSWGGGPSGGAIALMQAIAHRENVFRIEFSVPVYFSRILDEEDGSVSSKWSVAVINGTGGMDGNATRSLNVSSVFLPNEEDGVTKEDVGRFVDVVVDRPMTPHPSVYEVSFANIFSSDLLSSITTDSFRVPGVYRRLSNPELSGAGQSRDFANPQTMSAAQASLPDPNDRFALATLRIDDTGDYAFDEGNENLKKRVIRRLITRKNGFAHLPGYGVGVPFYGKRLAKSSVVASIAAEAEAQISREPDVSRVKVRPIVDPNIPNLVRFQILVKPRTGVAQMMDVPFSF